MASCHGASGLKVDLWVKLCLSTCVVRSNNDNQKNLTRRPMTKSKDSLVNPFFLLISM